MGASVSVCLDHLSQGLSSCRCCEAWQGRGEMVRRLTQLEDAVLRWTEATDAGLDRASERLLAAGRDIRARRSGRAR